MACWKGLVLNFFVAENLERPERGFVILVECGSEDITALVADLPNGTETGVRMSVSWVK